MLRLKGGKTDRREFPKKDSVLAMIEAFADAVAGRSPYPIILAEVINTIAAFEAIIRSMETDSPVSVERSW